MSEDSLPSTAGDAAPDFQSTILRLETQIEVLPKLLSGVAAEHVMARPVSGQWSAHENLAHLGRHHELFLDRLRVILRDDAPHINQYRAEDDPAWPQWSSRSLEQVLTRLKALRAEIIQLFKELSPAEEIRVGIHPLFGEMNLTLWLEFFLLHEAHHLYVVMTRLAQAKRSAATGSADKLA